MEGAGKGRSRGRARVTEDPSVGGGHRQGASGGNGGRGDGGRGYGDRGGSRGDGGRGYGDRGDSGSRGYSDRGDGGSRGYGDRGDGGRGYGDRGDGGGGRGYGDRGDGGGGRGYGDRGDGGGRGYGDRGGGGGGNGGGGGERSQRPAWGAQAGRGEQSESARGVYQSQPGPSQPRPQAPPQTQAQGRATVHRAPDGGGNQGGMRGVKRNTSGEIDDGRLNTESKCRKTDVGRGAVRGRRIIPEFLRTKPQEMNTKVGSTGTPVSLQTNYFCLKKRPEWNIFQYRIDFEEEIELMDVRKKIMYLLKHLYGGYIFDGTILSITSKLRNDEFSELIEKPAGDGKVTVKFKYVGTVSMDTSNSLQFLNLILRRALQGLSLDLIGRNYYDSAAARRVDQNSYDLWPGYLTSIRQHESELLVCCEIVHKVVRRDTAYDILMKVRRSGGDIPSRYKNDILGQTVMTNYNKKTYRIDDVDFTKSPMSTFEQKGVQVSFVQYYKQRYNITIRDEKQPLLLSRAKDRDIRAGKCEVMALIPELCLCTGFTNEMVADKRFMRAAQDVARLNPDGRVRALQAFNRRLLDTPASINHLKEWNLILDNKLVDIPGRVLPPQKMLFGNGRSEILNENADWTTTLKNHVLYRSVKLERWTVVAYDRIQGDLQKFLSHLKKVAQGLGFDIRDPQIEYAQNDRVQIYNSVIEKVAAKNDPQLIMVVVSNDNADRYSNIKKKTCVDRAIPTQVIQYRNLAVNKPGVASKVAIQMNCKLGGAPWFIDFPAKGVMVIGYDVCHDPRDKSQSWGAMVASMDFSERIQFFSTVQRHSSGEELSNSLVLNVTKALQQFRQCHKTLPMRILIYRDGVGDGQLHFVHEHEVKVLEQKLNEIYQTANEPSECKLFYCIVSKRINTRIFRSFRNAADNPIPGTIVDDVITLPERFDFFLISQSVRQGTVSPTSYNVLHNTSKWRVDLLQLATYKMTHLYYNWSGTTRVPALCQYAHKLAFLVSQSIHQTPSSALENKLYFL